MEKHMQSGIPVSLLSGLRSEEAKNNVSPFAQAAARW